MKKITGLNTGLIALGLVLSCTYSTGVLAVGDETFRFDVGGSINQINSEVKINGKLRGNNAKIDLEDDLNFDDETTVYVINAAWRFADRHRLSLQYTPIDRDSSASASHDIEYKDTVIHTGGYISAESEVDIFDFNYIYSAYKGDNLEVGLSAGVYWISLDFTLEAQGLIEDENGVVEFQDDYKDSATADAPLPLLGVSLAYQLSKRWELSGSFRYFEADIGDYNGNIYSAQLRTDYFLTDNFTMGLSMGTFNLDVTADDKEWEGNFGWDYTALQLYLSARF